MLLVDKLDKTFIKTSTLKKLHSHWQTPKKKSAFPRIIGDFCDASPNWTKNEVALRVYWIVGIDSNWHENIGFNESLIFGVFFVYAYRSPTSSSSSCGKMRQRHWVSNCNILSQVLPLPRKQWPFAVCPDKTCRFLSWWDAISKQWLPNDVVYIMTACHTTRAELAG